MWVALKMSPHTHTHTHTHTPPSFPLSLGAVKDLHQWNRYSLFHSATSYSPNCSRNCKCSLSTPLHSLSIFSHTHTHTHLGCVWGCLTHTHLGCFWGCLSHTHTHTNTHTHTHTSGVF